MDLQPDSVTAAAPATSTPLPPGPPGPLGPSRASDGPAASPAPAQAETPEPHFDVVRVDADGQTVIAGKAVPNQPVEVLLDGEVVETVSADASGKFVAVIAAGPSGTARELRLRANPPDPPPSAAPGSPQAPAHAPEAPERLDHGRPDHAAARSGMPAAAEPSGNRAGAAPAGGPPPARRRSRVPRPEQNPQPVPMPATRQPPPRRRLRAAASCSAIPSSSCRPVPPEFAPALVQPKSEELALLQPGGPAPDRVVLDQLTQTPDGDLLLRGRARPHHAVRIYGNGRVIATVAVAQGAWSLTVPGARADDIRLLRLDEIGPAGRGRKPRRAPFDPRRRPLVVRDRRSPCKRATTSGRSPSSIMARASATA